MSFIEDFSNLNITSELMDKHMKTKMDIAKVDFADDKSSEQSPNDVPVSDTLNDADSGEWKLWTPNCSVDISCCELDANNRPMRRVKKFVIRDTDSENMPEQGEIMAIQDEILFQKMKQSATELERLTIEMSADKNTSKESVNTLFNQMENMANVYFNLDWICQQIDQHLRKLNVKDVQGNYIIKPENYAEQIESFTNLIQPKIETIRLWKKEIYEFRESIGKAYYDRYKEQTTQMFISCYNVVNFKFEGHVNFMQRMLQKAIEKKQ